MFPVWNEILLTETNMVFVVDLTNLWFRNIYRDSYSQIYRINPDKKDFSAYDDLGEIYKVFDEFKKREIKNLGKENEELRKENEELKKGKESLIEQISKRLLELKFKKATQ